MNLRIVTGSTSDLTSMARTYENVDAIYVTERTTLLVMLDPTNSMPPETITFARPIIQIEVLP